MDFTELGLTKNEAKVYESLITSGKSTAAEISKHSGVPYGRIYNVLDSLEAKGLIKLIPEEIKKFVPSDPQDLDAYINKKKSDLDELQKKLHQLKTIYQEHKHDAVEVVYGKRNFHKIANEMKSAVKTSYSIKYTFDLDPRFVEGSKRRIKMGVVHKSLGRFDKETEKNLAAWRKVHTNIKPIPNDGIAMGITDEEEVMIGLIKSNMTLLIKDKPFAKIMKELFECYYDNH